MQLEITGSLAIALVSLAGSIVFASFKVGNAVGRVLTQVTAIRQDVDLLMRHVFGERPPQAAE